MNDRAVHFSALEVDRVLGIGHGDRFELSDLSPGVNLIHGPNGSGKSTTALVIQELLWPGHTGLERPTAAGTFRDGGREWQVAIDAGHFQTACDGQSGSVPELGPSEHGRRYLIALHELIGDENADFAKTIADASQGGYDLEAAAIALGFTERPSLPRNLSTRLKESQRAVEEAKRTQRGIVQKASELPEQRKQRDRATDAERRIDLLRKALDYHHAVREYRRIEQKLNALEGVARLRGDEREELDQLAERREKQEEDLKAEREKVERANQELDELELPDEGVDDEVLASLRSWRRKLDRVESDLRMQQGQLSKAHAEEKKSRARLGEHLTNEQLASIDSVEVGELSTFARQSDQVRAQRNLFQQRRRWLDQEEPEEVGEHDERQIRDGITTLSRWLASPAAAAVPKASPWWPLAVAAMLIALLGIILAFVHHWAWVLAMLPAVGVALWDWRLRRPPPDVGMADPRVVHQQSYEATGLERPRVWEVTAISELQRRLICMAELRAREDERLKRLSQLKPEAEELAQQQGELTKVRRELEERLGLRIEVSDQWLPLLIDNIGAWQRSSAEASGARKALEEGTRQRRTLLDQIDEALHPFGYGPIDSAELAAHMIEALADRQARHRTAIADRHDGQRRMKERIEPEIQMVANRRQNIFQRLDLDESNEPTIDDWLADRPHYLDLKKKLAEADTIHGDRHQSLSGDEDLLQRDPVELEEEIDEQRTIAGMRDELSERIARTERDIDRAKDGHELSDALEARERATVELAAVRNQNISSVVGDLLMQWVRNVAIERSRPRVFRRANKLFVQFTRGTLQLELNDHANPPEFRARRGSGPSRPVDRLSIGERVQLLIAVRMAFLEQDELTRLPLLLDEALGTSDDGRAGVIIDTIIDIAREGRQVFYFTAQQDEVGKWLARLRESSVPHTVIDLARIRRPGSAAIVPLPIHFIDVPRPPAPNGMRHDEYSRTLDVPCMNPEAEDLDDLHLWHLIDDVGLLHQLLCHQITSWSQLRTLLEHGGAGLVEDGNEQFERAKVAAKAIDAACQAWRIGRGKRVDRRALQDSGCVSDRFMEELAQLANRIDGNAQGIIEALDQGKVKQWQTKNTEGLRAFFEEKGFLSTDDRLDPGKIRARVLAAVADDLREDRIEIALVDRIVGSLP